MFVKVSLIAAFGFVFVMMGAVTPAGASEGAGPSAMALSSMRVPSPDAWNASTSPEGRGGSGNTTVLGARDRVGIVIAENESSSDAADSDSDSSDSDDQADSSDQDRQDQQDQMDQQQNAGNQPGAQGFGSSPNNGAGDAGEVPMNAYPQSVNPYQANPYQANPYQ